MPACAITEHRAGWVVRVREGNHSAFSGYQFTRSAYSLVVCPACGHLWRTRAAYVTALPDEPIPRKDRTMSQDPTDRCRVCATTTRTHTDDCTSQAAQIYRAGAAFGRELTAAADRVGGVLSGREVGDPRVFDVAALAGIVEQWALATDADDTAEAQRLAADAIDCLMGTFAGGAIATVNETVDPGIYFTEPQGYALIVGAGREVVIADRGGVVTIAGVQITDWDRLEALGERLATMAREKRTSQVVR